MRSLNKIFTVFSAALLLVSSTVITNNVATADNQPTQWGYTGHNSPENWGSLSPNYQMCNIGKNQSPINITTSLDANLPSIRFNYKTSPSEIINNGKTIQVNVEPGSNIVVDGVTYALKQYHFHTPSENHIAGKSFPLEAHFVHADANGNLAVVAVMFEEGKANDQLAKIWSNLPMKAGENNALKAEVKDIHSFLPQTPEYYRFNGSLTTPPCSEGVKWMVMKEPLTVSQQQVEKFSLAVNGTNNRPIQPQNARMIIR
ncbi:carbonic anhydrase [Nostoc parmelioides]|uniref:Carbonic anhydrase n=1 Tax=Nostoc parmelioides FACHB-3921 TaxID=2692909 RepID=A0ABR8BMH8_9NOSO|nr:carbonic anhydrase [Nostoc parmelioides]MBD2255156.1 carbonic anhydrase [Nostoc parmelioides FACHB-3921]